VIERALGKVWDTTLDLYDLDRTFPRYGAAATRVLAVGHRQSSQAGTAFYRKARAAAGLDPDDFVDFEESTLDPARALTSLQVTGPATVKRLTGTGLSIPQAGALALAATERYTERAVLEGGRTTLMSAVARDKDAVGYARVSARTPCAFCAMLISRGPVYSAGTAGFLAHDGCACEPMPVFRTGYGSGWTDQAVELRRLYEDDDGWTPEHGRSKSGTGLHPTDFRAALADLYKDGQDDFALAA
jgi:hypothetical protein